MTFGSLAGKVRAGFSAAHSNAEVKMLIFDFDWLASHLPPTALLAVLGVFTRLIATLHIRLYYDEQNRTSAAIAQMAITATMYRYFRYARDKRHSAFRGNRRCHLGAEHDFVRRGRANNCCRPMRTAASLRVEHFLYQSASEYGHGCARLPHRCARAVRAGSAPPCRSAAPWHSQRRHPGRRDHS